MIQLHWNTIRLLWQRSIEKKKQIHHNTYPLFQHICEQNRTIVKKFNCNSLNKYIDFHKMIPHQCLFWAFGHWFSVEFFVLFGSLVHAIQPNYAFYASRAYLNTERKKIIHMLVCLLYLIQCVSYLHSAHICMEFNLVARINVIDLFEFRSFWLALTFILSHEKNTDAKKI